MISKYYVGLAEWILRVTTRNRLYGISVRKGVVCSVCSEKKCRLSRSTNNWLSCERFVQTA